jgi:hypothetical protein
MAHDELDALIEDIADTYFGIVTLRERKVDRLDFYEVHVHSIREALKAAYEAGKNAARDD